MIGFGQTNVSVPLAFYEWFDMQIQLLLQGQNVRYFAPSLIGRKPWRRVFEPLNYEIWQLGRIRLKGKGQGSAVICFPHLWADDALSFLEDVCSGLTRGQTILMFDLQRMIEGCHDIKVFEKYADLIAQRSGMHVAAIRQGFTSESLPAWVNEKYTGAQEVWGMSLSYKPPRHSIDVNDFVNFA